VDRIDNQVYDIDNQVVDKRRGDVRYPDSSRTHAPNRDAKRVYDDIGVPVTGSD